MGATRAFLGEVECLIEKDGPIRTTIDTQLTASTLFRINDDKPVITFKNGSIHLAFIHAGSILAVHAHFR
jgi:hypothetical protein